MKGFIADVACRPRSSSLFASPFAAYAAYLVLRRKYLSRSSMDQRRGLDTRLDGSRDRRHWHACLRHFRAAPRGGLYTGSYREWPACAGALAMSQTQDRPSRRRTRFASYSVTKLLSILAALAHEEEETGLSAAPCAMRCSAGRCAKSILRPRFCRRRSWRGQKPRAFAPYRPGFTWDRNPARRGKDL